jgi:hypothetical protein
MTRTSGRPPFQQRYTRPQKTSPGDMRLMLHPI